MFRMVVSLRGVLLTRVWRAPDDDRPPHIGGLNISFAIKV